MRALRDLRCGCLIILLGGCSEARPAAAPANSGGTAIIAAGDLHFPQPILFDSYWDAEATDLLYPSLTRPSWDDGRLARVTAEHSPMALALRWEYVGGDRSVVRYHLRSDARWSDGVPVRAGDVTFTFRALKDPRAASPRHNMMAPLDRVVADDDTTVTFYFSAPQLDPQHITGHPIAPAHVFEPGDWTQMRQHPTLQDLTRLVVFGPFRIVRHERRQQIVLERNPTFQPRALLDRLVMRMIPDPTTAMVEFRSGNLDRITVGATGRRQLAEVPGAQFTLTVPRSLFYIRYNPERFAAFADRDIRRALALALDVDVLRETIRVTDNTVRAAGPYSPYLSVYDSVRMRPLPFDTAAANRILDAKGWRDGDGDGIRDRGAQPFRFEMLVPGGQHEADVAVAAQAMWRRVGIDARIRQGEAAGVAERFREGDWDAVMGGKNASISPDLTQEWTRNAGASFGFGSEELDARIRSAQQERDEAAQLRAWQDIALYLIDEQPITWLWWVSLFEVLSPNLRGVAPTTWSEFENAWEWWQPAESRRIYGAPPAS